MVSDVIATQEHVDIHTRGVEYRGYIIYDMVMLERRIDTFIACYFCLGNKVDEMIDLMLGSNRLSLDSKRKLMDTILKKVYPEFYIRYPDFKKDLNVAIRERNIFAHNTIIFDKEALSKSKTHVGMIIFSANTRVAWYEDKTIEDIRECISKCSNALRDCFEYPTPTQ